MTPIEILEDADEDSKEVFVSAVALRMAVLALDEAFKVTRAAGCLPPELKKMYEDMPEEKESEEDDE